MASPALAPARAAHRHWQCRALPLLAIAAIACGGSDDPAAERVRRAEKGRGDIVIGAPWPWSAHTNLLYGQGMQLAIDEVNGAGGIDGRQVTILKVDDHENVDQGRLVAQELARNPDVVAVIGHLQSYVTVPAAPVYDLAGLVLLSPAATSPEVTNKGYRRVFRTTFSDVDVGHQLAQYAIKRGYERVGIYYSRDEYGRGLANSFEEGARAGGTQIADRRSYDPGTGAGSAGAAQTAEAWADANLDAILIAGESEAAGRLAVELRLRGIAAPIIGGDALATPTFLRVGGKAVNGSVIATAFSPDAPGEQVQRFTAAFRRRFNTQPDVAAALAYDAVKVLAHSMAQAHSSVPEKVAAELHQMQGWSSVTGTFSFTPAGERTGLTLTKLIVEDGKLVFFDDRRAPGGPTTGGTP